ncbi:hypothetical protein QTQ03_13420 [Micromonospora sp. WMMA1363]|uniref:hypothetical protein n=1 Tax=Micromonospora sp. WMMA1363 TaxID=3053985 RepID=UPI00259D0106|nr:hypothetical protein [Micromonospora sp. WMMA1363]MDM4720530.1 hypothetical protein [Micromonospora sp. WMMA1363]
MDTETTPTFAGPDDQSRGADPGIGIPLNKNAVPPGARQPGVAPGSRVGAPGGTFPGVGGPEVSQVADLPARPAPIGPATTGGADGLRRAAAAVTGLVGAFPAVPR